MKKTSMARILDAKQINSIESNMGDLYLSLQFGFENKSEVEEGKILIINLKNFHIFTAILIDSIKFSHGGPTRGMFISREFNWTPLCDEDKIKELIRDFRLKELGI